VRDRALILLGFAGAMRRSELVGLDVDHVTWTSGGLKLMIARSKTDAEGEGAEIAIPRGRADDTCPVAALEEWLDVSEIIAGPLFRKINRGGVVETARLSADAVRQILLKRAAKAGIRGTLAERGQSARPPRRVCDHRLMAEPSPIPRLTDIVEAIDHIRSEVTGEVPPYWWTRVTTYAAAASCSFCIGVI
jgi:integrase